MDRPETDRRLGLIERALFRWVTFAQENARGVIAVAICVALCSVTLAAARLSFKTSRTDLIDPREKHHQDFVRYEQEFGDDCDIVVAVEGDNQAQLIAAIETLARDIQAHPKHFEKLSYRIKLDAIRAKGLYQLPEKDVRAIAAKMAQMGPLLSGGWSLLTVENLLATTRFRLLANGAGKPLDEGTADQVASASALLDALATSLEQESIYRSPWHAAFGSMGGGLRDIPEYFFSLDRKMAFLRVIPVKNADSFTGFSEPVRLTKLMVARCSAAFPDLRFGATGLPMLEDDEMQAAKGASGVSTALSIIGVALLFFVGFKAIRHPLFGLLTLLLAGCWTLGWVTLTVGHLNILSVSFIVTLIGMGIDYGIVWLSRFESFRAHGQETFAANLGAAASVGPSIVTSAIATALAFFTTMTTGFLGLVELGWIAGSGILICALATFTVLPALLELGGRRDLKLKDRFASEKPFVPFLQQHPAWVLVCSGCFALIVASQIPKVGADFNLLNLQNQGLASVQLERKLIEKTGTSGFYALAAADTPEQAVALQKRFEALPTVGRAIQIASLVPLDKEAKTPVIQTIHDALAKLPAKVEDIKLGTSTLSGLTAQFAALAKIDITGIDRDKLVDLRSKAERAAASFSSVGESQRQARLAKFEKRWVADLLGQLGQLKASANPQPPTYDDVPRSLMERYRSPQGRWAIQVFPKDSVWDLEPLRAFVADLESVDPSVTGHPVTAMHSLVQMSRGYMQSAVLALAIIFISVWLDCRKLGPALLAMLPLVLGCGMMLGLMGVLGIAFNPANMIALPLVIGIGVNYGVYMMHDYRRSTGRYYLCRRLARAIGLSALTTVVGFASLLCATHWGMVSIGLILSIGVLACMGFTFTFLPALLSLMSQRRPARLSVLHPEPKSTPNIDIEPTRRAA